MTLLIGLTGSIGSGKTSAGTFFRNLGVPVIEADDATKKAFEFPKTINAIKDSFGENSIKEGSIDRNYLKNKVFQNSDELLKLENILLPYIHEEIFSKASEQTSPYTIIIVPKLIEKRDFYNSVNRVLLIKSNEDKQVERVVKRDNVDKKQVYLILDKQMPTDEKIPFADDIIENNNSLDSLKEKVYKIHLFYLKITNNNLQENKIVR